MTYRVEINNFGRYRGRETGLTARFELPERGLVLAVGPNGQGKSIGFYGALAWGLFGSDGLKPDPIAARAGGVAIRTETHLVERFRKSAKGSLSLSWCTRDAEPVDYESPSKAQEALEKELCCDAERWKAVSLFHADTASSVFTGAVDSARKALIESLIPGFGAFDPALEQIRKKDVPAINTESLKVGRQISECEREVAAVEAASRTAVEQLQRLTAQVGSQETFHANRQRVAQHEKLTPQIRLSIQSLSTAIEGVHRQHTAPVDSTAEDEAKTQLRDAQRLKGLGSLGPVCSLCCQEVPEQYRSDLIARGAAIHTQATTLLEGFAKARRDAAEARSSQVESLASQRRKLQEDLDRSEQLIRTLSGDLRAYETIEKQRTHLLWIVEDSARKLTTLLEKRAALQVTADRLAEDAEVLVHEENVLGLRGFRAHLTGRFLGALEQLANVELAALLPGVQLEIRPYSETQKGDVRQKIGVALIGAYQGEIEQLSRGNRRRVDLAVFLGLRTLARASGPIPGWLTLDESLDSLDEQGIAAVARRLSIVAETELVVVISHSPLVARGLPFTQHWRVDAEGIHRTK